MSAPANVGVVGLAAMGASLARNLARHGNAVAIYNRHYSRTEKLMEEYGDEGAFYPGEDRQGFVDLLERPPHRHHHGQAGSATDAVINELAEYMEPGDIIVRRWQCLFSKTPFAVRGNCAPRVFISWAWVSPAARKAHCLDHR